MLSAAAAPSADVQPGSDRAVGRARCAGTIAQAGIVAAVDIVGTAPCAGTIAQAGIVAAVDIVGTAQPAAQRADDPDRRPAARARLLRRRASDQPAHRRAGQRVGAVRRGVRVGGDVLAFAHQPANGAAARHAPRLRPRDALPRLGATQHDDAAAALPERGLPGALVRQGLPREPRRRAVVEPAGRVRRRRGAARHQRDLRPRLVVHGVRQRGARDAVQGPPLRPGVGALATARRAARRPRDREPRHAHAAPPRHARARRRGAAAGRRRRRGGRRAAAALLFGGGVRAAPPAVQRAGGRVAAARGTRDSADGGEHDGGGGHALRGAAAGAAEGRERAEPQGARQVGRAARLLGGAAEAAAPPAREGEARHPRLLRRRDVGRRAGASTPPFRCFCPSL